jgi:hypothetical protein
MQTTPDSNKLDILLSQNRYCFVFKRKYKQMAQIQQAAFTSLLPDERKYKHMNEDFWRGIWKAVVHPRIEI